MKEMDVRNPSDIKTHIQELSSEMTWLRIKNLNVLYCASGKVWYKRVVLTDLKKLNVADIVRKMCLRQK